MSLFRLAWAYVWHTPLVTGLNVLLFALGIAVLSLLAGLEGHVRAVLLGDARGVSFVVGAKGSPLQVLMSTVYHADVPTGNIPLTAEAEISALRGVASAVPLGLGDSYQGYRIVGTRPSIMDFYGLTLSQGKVWDAPLQALVGAEVALKTGLAVGQSFNSVHGLGGGGGAVHDHHPLVVVGVLAPTGTVVDRLILTDIASVWVAHGQHPPHHDHDHGHDHKHDHKHNHKHDHPHKKTKANQPPLQITALLVRTNSPLATAQLPKQINDTTPYTAAVPAAEMTRLLALFGAGLAVLRAFGQGLMLVAGMSLFVMLVSALQRRTYDIAIMRAMGAGRGRVAALLVLEATLLSTLGAAVGIALKTAVLALLPWVVNIPYGLGGAPLTPTAADGMLALAALAIALLAAAVPAVQAARTPVTLLLKDRG
jgi:putative ABC transport system permease protein